MLLLLLLLLVSITVKYNEYNSSPKGMSLVARIPTVLVPAKL